ncbi:hypothetical protein [Nocardia pseudovaccinii]|uniref:hypothetical protein n=1 Tax=Nocardia pseudovaccinii TaxID=189540 RepID=UPI0007C7E441|nr:hypothetical protein [Nocardia pseudovaccinii]
MFALVGKFDLFDADKAAAFEEHERQPHTRRFLDQRGEYVESFRVEFLAPAAVKGLPAAD